MNVSYEELVRRRRDLRIEPYATLTDVGFDGAWITPFQITSCSKHGPVLLAFHWLDCRSIDRHRETLLEHGYLPKIRFNRVLDAALCQCGLARKDIYVTQAFHLVPNGRSEQIAKSALNQSFDIITRHELAGRKVVALGAIPSELCRRHGIPHEVSCHPSRRWASNETNASEIALAIKRLGF